MKYQYKMATFVFIIFIVTVLYNRYEVEVYTWFCENEQNGAACFVTHNLYLESESFEKADEFLNMSCKLEYEIACDEISKKSHLPLDRQLK